MVAEVAGLALEFKVPSPGGVGDPSYPFPSKAITA